MPLQPVNTTLEEQGRNRGKGHGELGRETKNMPCSRRVLYRFSP